MLKTKLNAEIRGSPHIKDLSMQEREIFFDCIFKRILQLNNEKK